MAPEKGEIKLLPTTGRLIVRAVCGVQLNYNEKSKSFMLMLDLNEMIDHLAMANNVH